jgi:threonine synthase
VCRLWRQLSDGGEFDLSEKQPLFKTRYGFYSGVSTHADRLATIRSVYDATGVLIDPHTADGVKVAGGYVEPDVPMVVLETALPAKFSKTIEQAIGHAPPPPANLSNLKDLPQRVQVMDCDAAQVRQYIVRHALG